MKSFDVSQDFDPEKFAEAIWNDIVPEIERMAQLKNFPALFHPSNPVASVNMSRFVTGLAILTETAEQRGLKKAKKLPKMIRIEMQTFDETVIRFRFVPLDEEDVPILEEKENPLLLVMPTLADYDRFVKEGYTYIASFSPRAASEG